jgi:hypothetical protein
LKNLYKQTFTSFYQKNLNKGAQKKGLKKIIKRKANENLAVFKAI